MNIFEILHFIKGVIFGFSIAMPVGPIAVLCVRRTLKFGTASGFVTGLGVAAADTLYGVCAGFGLVSVSQLMLQHQFSFRLVGGFALAVVGIKILLSEPPGESVEINKTNLWTAFLSAFVLAITNPITVVSFAALFAALGLATPSYSATSLLVSGIFVGSSIWWLILSQISHRMRGRLPLNWLHWFNVASGAIIVFCSAITFIAAFHLMPWNPLSW